MNKAELVEHVKKQCGAEFQSSAACKRAVDAVLDGMMDAITSGEGLRLVGFGSFEIVERAARTGRNPQTGETMEIAAKNVVKFHPSSKMAEAVDAR